MDFQTDIAKAKDQITSSKDILIVTHEHPTFDSIGSTLSLYLVLLGLGKKVTVACPDDMTVELSNFIGVNKIIKEFGRKNFIVSLDYVDGSIEKVSYNIDGDKFNLVIEPRAGFPPFSEDKVHFSYGASNTDLIISVDTIHLGGLKALYEQNKEMFAGVPIINVDRHPNNSRYGTLNLIVNQMSTTAEIVGLVISAIGGKVNPDVATNLLNAVYNGTNSFQNSNVSASAFDLAASCIRTGGKRFTSAATPVIEQAKAESVIPSTIPADTNIPSSVSLDQTQVKPAPEPSAPEDWLKPKIFKSSTLT